MESKNSSDPNLLDRTPEADRQPRNVESNSIEECRQLIRKYEAREEWEEVVRCCEQILTLNPQKVEAYRKLARASIRLNRPDRTISACRAAIALQPEQPIWIYENLGKALSQQGQMTEAISAYKQTIARDADRPSWVYRNLGSALYQQQQLDEAIAAYQKAIDLDSEQPFFTYKNFAEALAERGENDRAIATYQKAIEIKPDAAVALHLRVGNLQLQQKRLEAAIENYQQALDLKYGKTTVRDLKREIDIQFQEGSEVQLDAQIYTRLGDALSLKGLPQGAIECYLNAARLQPTLWEVHNKLNALMRRTSLKSASLEVCYEYYQKAVTFYGEQAIVHANLAEASIQLDRLDEAVTSYRTASYRMTIAEFPELADRPWDLDSFRNPDFLVLGVMKGGTSSLYDYIIKHPNVLPCLLKEVHFFSKKFELGFDWYRSHFPPQIRGDNFLVGEASPSYINKDIAPRIRSLLPNVKLIILLREPVKRTISHYNHNKRLGFETRTFEDAIRPELELLENFSRLPFEEAYPQFLSIRKNWNWHKHPGYVFISLYVYLIQEWMSLFPKQQVLSIKSEELYEQTGKVMERVFEFLGLPDHQHSEYQNTYPGSGSKVKSEQEEILSSFFEKPSQELKIRMGNCFSW
ncbi:MAG: tetratricopeptide repeat protein [Cyanobacteriota bacterium]|nr:tetratricopeptide repeat protein [Cyanobacteriota bacterium]